MTKAARTERARKAARARWDAAGDAERRKQRLTMVRTQAHQLGYRLVPIDDASAETPDDQP